MSYSLKTGETVNLNALARKSEAPRTVKVLSNVEKVRSQNDLTALHILIRVKGV